MNTLRQPVPSWAFLVVVLGLVGSMLLGYYVINNNTNGVRELTQGIATRSAGRDVQLCDGAHIFQDLKPFVPPKYVPRIRKDIDRYLKDINKDTAECHPKSFPKHERPKPHRSKAAPAPHPETTVTRTVVRPGAVVTKRVMVHPHRHHSTIQPCRGVMVPGAALCVPTKLPKINPSAHPFLGGSNG